jgi:hypothetical protein
MQYNTYIWILETNRSPNAAINLQMTQNALNAHTTTVRRSNLFLEGPLDILEAVEVVTFFL